MTNSKARVQFIPARIKSLLLFAACSFFILSCSPLTKTFRSTEDTFQDHVGFVLYDLKKKKTVFDYNGSKYFTPASNTKIFTFFASLKILGDSVPALKYIVRGDSLIFWGTGDPSLLYKNVFADTSVYHFLRSASQQLYFSPANFRTTAFGPGWAWDDYSDYYSAERSPLPVYGNITTISSVNKTPTIQPRYFRTSLFKGSFQNETEAIRDQTQNQFTYFPGLKNPSRMFEVPIKMSDALTVQLLSDTLKRLVTLLDKPLVPYANTLKSLPADSLYRVMMQDSDNFIAEQLLLTCSGVLSDTLKPEIAIRYMKQTFLKDMKDEPIWKDGSGLSRFNLFTPRSIVQLWEKIYQTVPQEKLFPLLATGGKKGTIRNFYKADKPYIFGKTGSLSNNHCLSGYLVTRKGNIMIFSFMNSHYTRPTSEVRNNMQEILKQIYEKY